MFRKLVLFVLVVLVLVGLGKTGLLNEADDMRMMAEHDAYNKQQVIKDWELRCFQGDRFDESICKSLGY